MINTRIPIEIDDTRLGQIYKLREEGKNVREILEVIGKDDPQYVLKKLRHIRNIENNTIPGNGYWNRREYGQCVRGFIQRNRRHLDEHHILYLQSHSDKCN